MRILEQLGSCTYRIWDPQLARERVLKSLGTGSIAKIEPVLRPLSHPNLLGASRIVDYQGTPHALRDWVPGTPLDLFSATPERARRIVAGIDSALRFLHGQRRVHGRLHPGNVIITPEGQPVLVDVFLPPAPPDLGSERVRFLSPARLRGRPPSRRADRFALGVIAYRLLSGNYPHPGEDGLSLAASVLYAPVARLDRAHPQAALVEQALGLSQPWKFPSARLLATVAALLAALTVATLWNPPKPPVKRKHRKGVSLPWGRKGSGSRVM